MIFKSFSVTPPENLFGYYAILHKNILYKLNINMQLEPCDDWYKSHVKTLKHIRKGDSKNINGYEVECLYHSVFNFKERELIEKQIKLNSTYLGTTKYYIAKNHKRNYKTGQFKFNAKVGDILNWEHKTELNIFYDESRDQLILIRKK